MNNGFSQEPIIPTWRWVCRHPIYFLAFGFGSGLSPKAPGTMGSLVGVALYYLFSLVGLSNNTMLVVVGILFFVGIWISKMTSDALGVHDHGGIVIDEIVAMWLLLCVMPPQTWVGASLSFILFRFFDIVKPWPICWFDQKVGNGLGIMLDDLIAAFFAIGVLYFVFGLSLI